MPILVFALLCIEAVLLIKLGQSTGGTLVLAEILVSGILGYGLLRLTGRAMVQTQDFIDLLVRPREAFKRSGWQLLIAAILLFLPGILTDVIGLVLLVRHFMSGGSLSRPRSSGRDPRNPDVIDVEFQIDEDDERT